MTSNAATPAFMLLMPLWAGDTAERAHAALRSATTEQILPPTQIVLSVDGPVPAPLEEFTAQVDAGKYGAATVLRHEHHRGLAATLHDGLLASEHEVIARADADDLCRPERFSTQIPAFIEKNLDLLGSAMQEFSDAVPPGTGPTRRRPLTHEHIRAYLPTHCPFHHPTVVYRRSTVLAVGSYRELPLLEDYWLWERMLLGGARTANLPDVLVDYRVDENLFARRGGTRLLASDLRFQRQLLRDGVTTPITFARNLAIRAAYRTIPGQWRRRAYRTFVERT